MNVCSYDTGSSLSGTPSDDLVRASLAARPTGAVEAYCDGGVWRPIAEGDRDHYRRNLGIETTTVYVEGVSS